MAIWAPGNASSGKDLGLSCAVNWVRILIMRVLGEPPLNPAVVASTKIINENNHLTLDGIIYIKRGRVSFERDEATLIQHQ